MCGDPPGFAGRPDLHGGQRIFCVVDALIAATRQEQSAQALRLKRLHDAIEAGIADLEDRALKERIASLKAIRD
jgi:hypothetical protein